MTPTTDQTDAALYLFLRQLENAREEPIQRLAHERLTAMMADDTLGLDSFDSATDEEQYGSRLAILRPFLAQLWQDAYEQGMDDFDERMPSYTPNPFKDPS